MGLPLETPLAALPGTQRFLPKLKKLGLETVRDLLYYFPHRYEDYSEVRRVDDLVPGEQVTIQGVVEEVDGRQIFRRNMTIVDAVIVDDAGSAIRATWFNQPYLKETFRPGRRVSLSGKVSLSEKGEVYLSHPTYEFISSASSEQGAPETKHTGRLVPIYGETKGLTSKGIRFLMEPILHETTAAEWLPQPLLETYAFPEIQEALRSIHFPERLEDAEAARKRFAFEELFLLQLATLKEKLALAQTKAERIPTNIDWLKDVLTKLPFELTQSQKQSLWEIIKDLDAAHPMNRLLQGDVGSGKTAVAALAALITSTAGSQAAFMAPTEILARQHFETVKKLFKSIPAKDQPVVGLLAAGEAKIFYENDLESTIKRADFLKKLEKGELQIAIGTHALIQKGVKFKKLGLAIVDEQHRFGVRQRAELLKRKTVPHYLSMSATPIPRTLMLTVFGDLDVSLITELPSGRKKIVTEIVPPAERQKTYDFIREKIKEGRQAFVICPRIEIPDEEDKAKALDFRALAMLEVKSVKEEYEKLAKNVFPEFKIAMLHGKMKTEEKEAIMREFKEGKTHILISTSVVEVGVDVPNAAMMMIESSDRFGLAQLYQFRGRVGRGEHQSYCFLMTESDAKAENERLKALVAAKNGFELAEYDLKLRGPGEFLGESQTGLPDIAMESLRNPKLVEESRSAAKAILETDPTLKKFPKLAEKAEGFKKKIHLE
jgi:ATP-dependent DNA helicase RecG